MRVRRFVSKSVVFSAWLLAAGVAQSGPVRAQSLASFPDLRGFSQAGHSAPVQTISVSDKENGSSSGQNAAANSPAAERFVENMAQRALGTISNTGLSSNQKKAEFSKILQGSFDMDTIGRFSLGTYWRRSTEDQRREYLSLFKKMVVEVYSSRFESYRGEQLKIHGSRVDGEKDVIVTSFIVPQEGAEVQIDWRVRNKGGGYKVVDVIVEGVSMSMTQRSDFSSIIQQNGGDMKGLLNHMKTTITENTAQKSQTSTAQ